MIFTHNIRSEETIAVYIGSVLIGIYFGPSIAVEMYGLTLFGEVLELFILLSIFGTPVLVFLAEATLSFRSHVVKTEDRIIRIASVWAASFIVAVIFYGVSVFWYYN